MTLTDCLRELRHRGLVVRCEGGSLRVDGPKGALSEGLRAALRLHKQALLERFADGAAADAGGLPRCEPDPARHGEPFPMSDLQLGFHLAEDPFMEFHVRPHGYVEKDVGQLDLARYEAAWRRALRRHRMDIVAVLPDGRLQQVRQPGELRAGLIDLSGRTPAEVDASLAATRAGMARSELPLDRWPWLDLRVSRWQDGTAPRHRIHCNLNSFFLDFHATARLLAEVDRFYREPEATLPPRRLSCRDAVLALERLGESAAGQVDRRYWEDRLPGLPRPPDIPLCGGMDRRCRSRLSRRERRVAAGDWQAFSRQARRVGVTPGNALFAAYAEVLSAWGNSRHFVLSNMMTRRLDIHPEIRDVMGNFASLYPLEVDLRHDASFAARARRLQAQVARDSERLAWGGMRVMQAYNRLAGGFGQAPIPFVLGSALFAGPVEPFDFACLETSQVLIDNQFFELKDGRLNLLWDLFEDFFPEGLADAMWEAYGGLVERLARDAPSWEADAPPLVPAAQFQARQRASPGRVPAPAGRLDGLLRDAARRHAPRPAVLAPGRSLSYARLDAASDALARRLQAEGVGRECVVPVFADRGAGFLVGVHAALKAGAAYLPIDPALPPRRVALLLQDSGAACAVAEAPHADRLPGVRVLVPDLEAGAGPVGATGGNSDLAYLIYTSGSTGRPKGVMIEHRAALNTVLEVNRRFRVSERDRLFGVSSCGFDLSVYDIFGAAAAGAAVVYPDPPEALNPAHWLDLLAEHRVTVWNSAPALAALMADAAEFRGLRLDDLRLVLLSGDWIPVDLPGRLRRLAPQAQVVSLGGATEASIWSIAYEIDGVDPAWTRIPYGYPMRNQPWLILDDRGRPVPDWTPGELHIGGDGLARGYWRDPGKTADRFITHPVTGDRLYRTGDIGRYRPGGLIELLGRRDAQVKVQGHRVELGEIESVLASHPGVAAAVASVRTGPSGEARLAAGMVAAPGAAPEPEAARRHLADRLPDYMVPQCIHLLDRLPLTASGKVDREALPVPPDQPPRPAARAPRDALEERLLALWRAVLARPDAGVSDDFFDLGGQSLQAVRLVGRIREVLGARLSLADVWRHRTVAALAQRLRGPATQVSCLVPMADGGEGAPLYLVHPAGGDVGAYRPLAARLGRPVFAFQALGGGDDSVEDFAATYLDALRQAQPDGPVLLGGWSSGAPVAYEMARRLRQLGRDVRGLVVLDSPAPRGAGPVADDQLFAWFLQDLELAPALQAELAGQGGQAGGISRLAAALRVQGHPLGDDASQLRAVHRVFCGMVRATRAYRPEPCELDLLVLRASQGEVDEFAGHARARQPDWGWRQLAPRASVRSVAASHFSLLRPPAVDVVGTALQSWFAMLETGVPSP